MQFTGSSPLARGTPVARRARSRRPGLIPARAGNTLPADRAACNPWAHPRSRGEHTVSHSPLSSLRGSSPLARGTRGVRASRLSQVGLIPARAGNTVRIKTGYAGKRAHPRSRGEHAAYRATDDGDGGSSPLARGTPAGAALLFGAVGLIPARAGNTFSWTRHNGPVRAHPRSRGEHAHRVMDACGGLGSSPLARGTHLLTWDFTPYISKIESLWNQSLHPEYTISSHY